MGSSIQYPINFADHRSRSVMYCLKGVIFSLDEKQQQVHPDSPSFNMYACQIGTLKVLLEDIPKWEDAADKEYLLKLQEKQS